LFLRVNLQLKWTLLGINGLKIKSWNELENSLI
ncbi:MAG: hypothetical protein ACI9UV_003329, partial [Algoriphagus sp.]